jgi:hypothetical protein
MMLRECESCGDVYEAYNDFALCEDCWEVLSKEMGEDE